MNREIKFRVWDKLRNVLYPWESVKDWKISLVEDDRFIYQQFINFKDKNNKNIYEGEIITGFWSKGHFGEHKSKNSSNFLVKWDCSSFILYPLQYDSNSKFRTYPKWNAVKIIGNIYENTELLK